MQASTPPSQKDFFISYNHKDTEWAEWIANELEEAGYTTTLQAWDFAPGSNFILEMDKAMKETQRTIAILSPNYLQSLYTQPEWAGALRNDPTGAGRKLIPIRVAECKPEGLLGPIVYIDIVGLEVEAARALIIDKFTHINSRGKPSKPPVFPGAVAATPPPFPPTTVAEQADEKEVAPMPSSAKKPLNVCMVSSDHPKDKELRSKLENTLRPMQNKGLITMWHDGMILPGKRWQNEVDQHIQQADLILLLLSMDFYASDTCNEIMQNALARHQERKALVVPIILRYCDWESDFQGFMILPSSKQPITSGQDEAFLDITRGIRKVVDALLQGTYY